MSDVRVKGLSELNKFLQQLPAQLEANILRGALREGAKVVEADAKARVPEDTGRLKESIRVSTRLKKGRVVASIYAGGRSGAKKVMPRKGGGLRVGYELAFYAMWVEYGTAAHKILPRKPGGFLSIGGNFVRGVEHPGTKPRPYMRPALEAKAQEAVLAAANYMKQRLSSKRLGGVGKGVEVEAL